MQTPAPIAHPRICLCNSNIAWGGGEKWHLDAACTLQKRGFAVQIIAHPQGVLYQRAQQLGLSVFPFSISRTSFLNPVLQQQLKYFFQSTQTSHLVLGLPADIKSAGIAAARAGVGSIIYRRGSALPVRPTFFNRFLYSQILTGLIVNSKQTLSLVQTHPPLLDPAHIHLLYNGIDAAAFDVGLCHARASLRQVFNIPSESLVLGNAGRLSKQKGQHYLIEMMHLLATTNADIHLIIAGSGELELSLKEQSHSLGLEQKIHFAGFLDDLHPFWKSIDIFVLSSLWEGFGYVLAEAMLAQKPIIAFDTSNMPELITPAPSLQGGASPQSGILVPFESEDHRATALAHAVSQLASCPTQRAYLGLNGRQSIETRFSQSVCMDKLEEILRI